MLENSTLASQPPPAAAPSDSGAPMVKRYAPPNQRNRPNRRKSSERFDRSNSYGSDMEKGQAFAPRNIQVMDHGDSGSSTFPNENTRHRPRLISLEGCSIGEASQLMSDRWAAAMQSANDPSIDPSERAVVYSERSPPAWGGQFRLPHQIMSPTGGAGSGATAPPMDFLAELRRAKASAGGVSLDP